MTNKSTNKGPSRFDQLFATDKEHSTEGVLFLIEGEVGEPEEMSITLAHTGGHNFDYNEAVQRISAPYQTLIDQNQLPNEKMRSLLIQAFAETIVKAWVGITHDDKLAKCEEAMIVKVFEAKPAFFDACQRFARQVGNYRAEYVDGAVGNSPSSSDSS